MRLSAPIHHLKRRARLLSRTEGIALHEALDRVAEGEGFACWSLLATRWNGATPAQRILSRLEPGDLLLLAARPGQGKTRLGLQLLLEAAAEGREAVFFTLEYREDDARARIRALDKTGVGDRIRIEASDRISAGFIAERLSDAAPGQVVAVIDYLQILDQQRSKPPLADQMRALRDHARRTGTIFGLISQIDRAFDAACGQMPGMQHLRLPNPVDAGTFSKACFLQGAEMRFQAPNRPSEVVSGGMQGKS
ncbi:DNA helicase [Paracoccus caeni]|uniref:DNA helicase n=1 Tax=Paracoccus caeni TaxID=657651 RepID=A0A934W251_9RHOB|nr:DNA helicase [Paracoccus caeni]MBK4218058.1 DNA helicase [Paracoccus caeni]